MIVLRGIVSASESNNQTIRQVCFGLHSQPETALAKISGALQPTGRFTGFSSASTKAANARALAVGMRPVG
jgi:hypothetical protein